MREWLNLTTITRRRPPGPPPNDGASSPMARQAPQRAQGPPEEDGGSKEEERKKKGKGWREAHLAKNPSRGLRTHELGTTVETSPPQEAVGTSILPPKLAQRRPHAANRITERAASTKTRSTRPT